MSDNITNQLIRTTKISDLLNAKPINEQILKFGRNDVDNEISKSVTKCAIGLEIELSNHVLQILIEDIVDKYKFDSIEDIQECLKKGRRGHYGTTYNKLNMIVISDWMSKHLEEKAIERENQFKDKTKHNWKSQDDYLNAIKKGAKMREEEKQKTTNLNNKESEYQKFKAEYEGKKIKKQ